MKYLYKYPQGAYPYEELIKVNGQRSREELEYELLDIGIFNDNQYFDVFIEYAKADTEDILVKIMNLFVVSKELSNRLISNFTRNENGKRPVYGGKQKFQTVQTGATTISFTNIIMAIMAQGWGLVTKQAGVVL